MKKRTRNLIIQFIEYMISGGVWFWSGYVLIVLLDNHIGLFAANFVGNAVGISLNFLLQRYWVFKTKRPGKIAFTAGRYIVYTILNAFLLNYLILYGLEKYMGLKPEIGQFIASGFFTFWNYFWYRTWVFPEGIHPATERPHLRKVHKHLTTNN
jgi:putative flippase GtrA